MTKFFSRSGKSLKTRQFSTLTKRQSQSLRASFACQFFEKKRTPPTYKKRKKIKTHIWGPSAWTFLHAVSFAYPEEPTLEHKTAAFNLFDSLKFLLPCGECCSHYCTVFDKTALQQALESRDKFSRWLVEFHNSVNLRLKKPVVSYKQVSKTYLTEEAQCEIQEPCAADDPHESLSLSKNSIIPYVVCVLGLFLLLFLFFRNKK
jgi:hypothetical protein